ncbi:MAG: ABC transporter substrate-binding protein [Bacteroides sp.]|nr:ABC transporter substrate-binding protein [Bacteroides sp.]
MKVCKTGILPGAVAALAIVIAVLASCGGSHGSIRKGDEGRTVEMDYAENLEVAECAGYTLVTVRNPWDTVRSLQRYILIDRDSAVPRELPSGTVVRTPLSDVLVYSTVHGGLIEELGAVDAVGGMCNTDYVGSPELKARLADGRIADCGVSMSPDIEKIIELRPQAILLSPFENNDKYAKVGELGIPIIECADYMETSALGRAEWVKFYGMLLGKDKEAREIFSTTERRYNDLKKLAATAQSRPKVLTDQRYGQVWNVPGGNSTIGRLIEDAGGINPFSGFPQSGSVPLAPEKVLGMAHDADIWFVKFNQEKEKTMAELAADAPVNPRFKAYREGNVFGCNTRYIDYYEETPFHPDLLLEDMMRCMHPDLEVPSSGKTYYTKMK